jgi:tRNA-splicing ligase RtcB (3'-phosphate/5'-hydroxy nucleic acid ligase)
MKWTKDNDGLKIPIKSWCDDLNEKAMKQAVNLANHPVTEKHVALMPDCHVGYGMPIGGVIACKKAVIPNAVGVDIGCGMIAVETDLDSGVFTVMKTRREFLNNVKSFIPLGEGRCHKEQQEWSGFDNYLDLLIDDNNLEWPSKLDRKNLGTLGGGNHFIELQKDENNKIWLMIHSGSRNLGHKIAKYYNKLAVEFNGKMGIELPDEDLAYLDSDSVDGKAYIRDMNFALEYALENRKRMMNIFKEQLFDFMDEKVEFLREINIHHNYAAQEKHFEHDYWIHRKGAISSKKDQIGIIPGSMGTPSYIVKGKGNSESFMSSSHGAGRCMSRSRASRKLTVDECNKAMEGIVFDRWNKLRKQWKNADNKKFDLSEAPQAYKNIEDVMNYQLDLVEPIVKLFPVGVIKG